MKNLTDRELATVLAALRNFQDKADTSFGSHFHVHSPLLDTEIDELCERLNAGDGDSRCDHCPDEPQHTPEECVTYCQICMEPVTRCVHGGDGDNYAAHDTSGDVSATPIGDTFDGEPLPRVFEPCKVADHADCIRVDEVTEDRCKCPCHDPGPSAEDELNAATTALASAISARKFPGSRTYTGSNDEGHDLLVDVSAYDPAAANAEEELHNLIASVQGHLKAAADDEDDEEATAA